MRGIDLHPSSLGGAQGSLHRCFPVVRSHAGRRVSAGRARSGRGFTLTELMITIVIIGVLATVGMVSVRQYMTTAKASESLETVQAIRAAEERFHAEGTGYLSASQSLTTWYPGVPSGTIKRGWWQESHSDYEKWRMLDVTQPGPTQCGYAVQAGTFGETVPGLATASQPTWPTPQRDWYVIQAACDMDGDTKLGYVAASSFSDELYREDFGE